MNDSVAGVQLSDFILFLESLSSPEGEIILFHNNRIFGENSLIGMDFKGLDHCEGHCQKNHHHAQGNDSFL